jgi:hypothetical protein
VSCCGAADVDDDPRKRKGWRSCIERQHLAVESEFIIDVRKVELKLARYFD